MALVVFILAAALWIRCAGLGRPLWEDEATMLYSSRQGLAMHWAVVANPTALTHRLACALLGTGSLVWVRLPYMLAGLLGVAVGWRLGRLWRSWTLGVALAAALALWPYKVFWDVLARDYVLVMLFGLLSFWTWERFRLRPGWGRLLGAAAITAAGALTHELSVVLLCLPVYYLSWVGVALAFRRVRRIRRAGLGVRAFFALGKKAWLHAAALTVALGLTGAALVGMHGQHLRRLFEHRDLAARAAAATQEKEPRLPTPGQALGFVGTGLGTFLHPGHWSLAPLLGINQPTGDALRPYHFNQLTVDPLGLCKIKVGGWADNLLAAMVLVGTGVLLWRSPPLAAGLWTLVWAVSLLIQLNQHIRTPQSRYYTLAVLALLVLAVVGAEALSRPLRWAVWRWRPRLYARGWPVVVALGIGLVLIGLAGRDRKLASHVMEDWQGFYEQVTQDNPGGVFFTGTRPGHFWSYRRLDLNRQRRAGVDEAANTGLRHQVLSAEGWRLNNGLQLMDHLNQVQSFVIFQPEYEADRQPYMPLKRYKSLFDLQQYRAKGLAAWHASTGRRVFVTGGRAQLPLQERMRIGAGEYRLDCYFETPGRYRLSVECEPGVELWQARMPNAKLTATSPTLGTLYTFECETSEQPMQVVELDLQLSAGDQQEGVLAPALLAWQRIEPERWRPAGEGLSIGNVRISQTREGFEWAAPLRIDDSQAMFTQCYFQLLEAKSSKRIAQWACTIEQPVRRLEEGAQLWCGPYELKLSQLKAWEDHTLALYACGAKLKVALNDPRLKAKAGANLEQHGQELISVMKAARLCWLRAVCPQGQWMIQKGR